MIRPLGIFLAGVVVLIAFAPGSSALSSRSLTLRVYADGYVYVTQAVSVDPKASSVQVPLLSGVVSNLVATDQNGSPLSYGLNSKGSNITVYTLGATAVTLRYDTGSLTAKNGTVWTLAFVSLYNSTVILPQFSTLVSASGTPYSINVTNNSPEVTLSRGSWKVSYGVPLVLPTTSATTTQPNGGALGATSTEQIEALSAAGATVAAGALTIRWWRRRRFGPLSGELRPDDVQVLNFIQEKGGKVLELEIRTRFALPKTSAWRQIKRLERLGYVRVTKVGSQNQIEILKERAAGD